MISHPRSNDDNFVLLEHWIWELPQIPVSILSGPTTFDYGNLVQMRDLGADIFTVLVEAVTPGIFDRSRGRGVDRSHNRDKCWRRLDGAAEIYGLEHFDAPHLRHGQA